MSDIRIEADAREAVIESDLLTVSVHLVRGTFDIAGRVSGAAVRDCAASVRTREGGRFTSRGSGFDFEGTAEITDVRGTGVEVLLRRDRDEHEPDLTLTITVYESQPFILLRAEMTNKSAPPMRVESFEPLARGRVELPGEPAEWRFYKHGWQSWSPTLVLPCSGEDETVAPPVHAPATSVLQQSGRFVSDLVTAVAGNDGRTALLAGFVTAADQFSQAWLDRDERELSAISYADGLEVAPGGSLASEVCYVEPSTEALDALESYGTALASLMGATPDEGATSGWCSWYRYFTAVTEEQVVENLDYLAAHRHELPLQYVQLDDGYQAGIGDWLDINEKFPHGMKWLVERIHDAGFGAGIWLAPFMVGANSRLFKEHPDWVVRYESGGPAIATFNWNQLCYGLDLARDDVIDWLRGVFETVTREWGFDYVKIDFVFAGALDGIRADGTYTRAQAYRRGLEQVREVVGERFVLGCGNPMGPSIGLVDGSRIGPDVAPAWEPDPFPPIPQRNRLGEPSALNSIRSTIARYWMHGRLWQNDPDCVLVRQVDTSLTDEEVRTLATVIALSGGMVLDSDDLTALSDERREMLSLLLPPLGKAARPLDLFSGEMPRLLELDHDSGSPRPGGGRRLIGVFNWHDATQQISVPLGDGEWCVFDAWQRRYLGGHSGDMALDVPAHGCRLLSVRQALDRPQVVGSSFHLLQGAVEIADEVWTGDALAVTVRPIAVRRGALYVRCPNGESVRGVDGVDAEVGPVSDGVQAVRFDLPRAGPNVQPLDVRIYL